jgi:uncharacterized DUF497 family protein
MRDEEFEWDDAKAAANLAKHGVDFVAARQVFDDAFNVERPDPDPDEDRRLVIGMVNGRLLSIVYTERATRIRLISARKATSHERRYYYSSQTAE